MNYYVVARKVHDTVISTLIDDTDKGRLQRLFRLDTTVQDRHFQTLLDGSPGAIRKGSWDDNIGDH